MRKRGASVESRPSAGVRSYLGAAFATMSLRPAADPASWKPRGASEANAPSIGFNIGLPVEQQANAYAVILTTRPVAPSQYESAQQHRG